MTPTRIYLVRHGESQANAGGETLENPLVPLTKLGERQAVAIAALLPHSDQPVWASPFKRARDTAAPYCARVGRAALLHEDLREFEVVDTALMRGTLHAERDAAVARYWLEPDPDHRQGPGAETFREFHARVARARSEFLPSLPDGTVVFGHGMWMALLFWQMWGFTAVDRVGQTLFRRCQLGFPTPNCSVYRVTHLKTGQWEVQAEEASMRELARISAAADLPLLRHG